MISLLLVILCVAVICWAVTTLIPMPPNFASVIYVIAGLVILIYVLRFFGLIGGAILS